MIVYLIKSACCAVVLLLVYRFVLQKEKMHRFNRAYLLLSAVLSLVMPLVTLPAWEGASLPGLETAIPAALTETAEIASTPVTFSPVISRPVDLTAPVLSGIYCIVVLALLARFGRNIYRLISAQRNSRIFYHQGFRFILLDADISSYTFFNTIFLGPRDYGQMQSEVVKHEMAHVRQMHSIDILFIELVRIIFWFNPIYIFYKRSIQLNHEFLADEAVVQQCESIPAYQHLLLDRISLASDLSLGSRFNYSITKKRLQMMTRKTSHARAMLKQFALVPVLTICFIAFGARNVMSTPVLNSSADLPQQDTGQKKKNPAEPPVVPVGLLKDVPFTKEGISNTEMEEYKTIERKYLDRNDNKEPQQRADIFNAITDTEKKRLESFFLKMNRGQQQSVSIVFLRTLPPSKRERPTQAQLDKWKNPSLYGVWIGDRKIANEELNNYKVSDFGHYFASNLHYTEKAKQDVMKKYNLNVMYKVQVNIMTNEGYDAYYKNRIEEMKKHPYQMLIIWRRKSTGI